MADEISNDMVATEDGFFMGEDIRFDSGSLFAVTDLIDRIIEVEAEIIEERRIKEEEVEEEYTEVFDLINELRRLEESGELNKTENKEIDKESYSGLKGEQLRNKFLKDMVRLDIDISSIIEEKTVYNIFGLELFRRLHREGIIFRTREGIVIG